jgi:hypothetical protein
MCEEKKFRGFLVDKAKEGRHFYNVDETKGTRLGREPLRDETFERRIYSKGREEAQAQEEEYNCHWINTRRKDIDR